MKHDTKRYLRFTDVVDLMGEADLLFASGSLQYLPQQLEETISSLQSRPRFLVVNLLPVHETLTYYTLQSIGAAFCPYRIVARRAFTESLEALGYESQDQWENIDRRCWIPFHREHSIRHYAGFAFRLRD